MDLTADAIDLDWPRVGRRVGVDLKAPELAGGLAAERNHPAIVGGLGAFFRATGLGHLLILSGCELGRRRGRHGRGGLLRTRLGASPSFSRVERGRIFWLGARGSWSDWEQTIPG